MATIEQLRTRLADKQATIHALHGQLESERERCDQLRRRVRSLEMAQAMADHTSTLDVYA